jgi:hypothetical protein
MPSAKTLRGVPLERDCFADEVAIDFRSLAAVIDRMRAAFFFGYEDPASPSPRAAEPACGFNARPDP